MKMIKDRFLQGGSRNNDRLRYVNPPKEWEIITFGAPQVICLENDERFLCSEAKRTLQELENHLVGIVNTLDPVPRVPSTREWLKVIPRSCHLPPKHLLIFSTSTHRETNRERSHSPFEQSFPKKYEQNSKWPNYSMVYCKRA